MHRQGLRRAVFVAVLGSVVAWAYLGAPLVAVASGAAATSATSTGTLPTADAGSGRLSEAASPDFNGDGWADLAIGVEGEGLDGSRAEGGAVSVMYGSADGLVTANNQLWSQDSPGVLGDARSLDTFGRSLGSADFDGDGYDDLAVGVPLETVGDARFAGAVNVLYGSPSGLASTGNQLWSQDSAGVPDTADRIDLFGQAVTAADFDADGYGDLAVGVVGEGSPSEAGAVTIIYGSIRGLTATGSQHLVQPIDRPEESDEFGRSLAAGDFDADGYMDLAVGAHKETVEGKIESGAVSVFHGSRDGLDRADSQFWHQASPGVVGELEHDEWFGWSVAVDDFDGDGYGDLAIAIRFDEIGGKFHAGSVLILYGSSDGLKATGSQLWSQGSKGVRDKPEAGDQVSAVTTGDFDADGFADVAMGFHGEDLREGTSDAGAVAVLYGSESGLVSTRSQFWHQGMKDVSGLGETDDRFGSALGGADFDGDGFVDLAVGVPGEAVAPQHEALGGSVNILHGGATGLSAASDQLWHQNAIGMLDETEYFDHFGAALG